MLSPIQRIPRYELLLKEYIHRLPEDSRDLQDSQSEHLLQLLLLLLLPSSSPPPLLLSSRAPTNMERRKQCLWTKYFSSDKVS